MDCFSRHIEVIHSLLYTRAMKTNILKNISLWQQWSNRKKISSKSIEIVRSISSNNYCVFCKIKYIFNIGFIQTQSRYNFLTNFYLNKQRHFCKCYCKKNMSIWISITYNSLWCVINCYCSFFILILLILNELDVL